MQNITIGSNTYGLVSLPASPGPSDIEIGMSDSVAVFESPFTKVQQSQAFPGGDSWDATITLPPMTRAQAWAWEAFMAELRGRLNVFQLGDPRAASPLGSGAGAPMTLTNGSNNLAMTTTLSTQGWTHNATGVLLAGDQFQIGYRLYRVCETVNADANGNASITVWPSLRETPADATPLVLAVPKGLFRLTNNRRSIHWSPSRLTTVSLQAIEAR